jgi:hypothetical protein
MKNKKSDFYPMGSLDGKANYKIYRRIYPDGAILERVFLNVNDSSQREMIIMSHYLQNYVRLFLKKPVGMRIISRDDPWDFKIELNGENKFQNVFNVEITSIADHKLQFEKMKREERYQNIVRYEKIPLHELIKINKLFPSNGINEKIIKYRREGFTNKDSVVNPYYIKDQNIFISATYDTGLPLESLIQEAIEKKQKKNHDEKEDTVLILDNRTMSYQLQDLHNAIDNLQQFISQTTFKEIWFYTGYYTEPDGFGGEYSFAPMKTTESQYKILEELRKEKGTDKNGVIDLDNLKKE